MIPKIISCEVIVPLVSGKNGYPWIPLKVPNWENATAFLFGGISPIALGVTGSWVHPTKGILVRDPQNRYEIAVDQRRVDELREYLNFTCIYFEQECLYFKVGNMVEFLDNPLGWP